MNTERGKTVSLYLTGEALRIAQSAVGDKRGGFSKLVHDLLLARSTPDNLALIRWSYWDFDEDDPQRLDRWISPDSTSKVLLMGTTMAKPLSEYSDLWKKFLNNGGKLFVLFQGELGREEGKPIYTPVKEDVESVFERRKAALNVVVELSKDIPKHSLVVRNSGQTLLSYSAIVAYQKRNKVDIQIHPYQFLPEKYMVQSPQFFTSTNLEQATYKLLADPINILWSEGLPEQLSK